MKQIPVDGDALNHWIVKNKAFARKCILREDWIGLAQAAIMLRGWDAVKRFRVLRRRSK